MSSLYNEKYTDVIKMVLEKQAQQIPLSTNVTAKKLVGKLSRELSGIPEPLNISSETTTSVDLKVNNLQNLGTLLQFLANNKIKLDGERIVYTNLENENLPEGEKNKLSPVSVNLSRDAVTRKWNAADFYTNLPFLIRYISFLQKKASSLKNSGDVQGRILEVMIGKLIDSINRIKPDSGLSRVPKSKPDSPKEIPEDTILDFFGSKVFDIKNPYVDQGQIKLLAKNLISRESLNGWMQGGGEFGPEAKIVMYDVVGQPKIIPYTNVNPEPNFCFMINVLYLRAQRLLRLSKSPEDTKKYNFFLNKVNQIGPTFTNPQGGACPVGPGISTTGLINKHDLLPGSGETKVPLSAEVSPQILERLIQSLPLDIQDIDFNRIKNFFTQYSKIMSRDNAQPAITAMGIALTAMATASGYTLTGNQQNFRLTRNVQELQAWLKPPAGNIVLPFLYGLQQVIIETGKVLGMFYNEYARTLYSKDRQVFTNEQKALVETQYWGSNSIYAQNLREIQSLMANIQSILSRRK